MKVSRIVALSAFALAVIVLAVGCHSRNLGDPSVLVSGVVTDSATDTPMSNACVRWGNESEPDTNFSPVYTNTSGSFHLYTTPGRNRYLWASATGYRSKREYFRDLTADARVYFYLCRVE